ncbi:MAG: ROK family protein, partial [Propionibacteriaceae bacterium]|nr:ROK family protein [Propionibacteriaceae bacterium]
AVRKPGKPGALLDLDTGVHRVVVLDLSAPDQLVGAVLNLRGEVLRRIDARTSLRGEELTGVVAQLARSLIDVADGPVLGAGVGTPGTITPDGVVAAAPNLGWRDEPLRRVVAEATGTEVFVENDANLAVLAESRFGGAGDDLLLVQLSRGVGAGLLVAGRIVAGAGCAAGEIGHVVVDPDGDLCACGTRGCLETLVSSDVLLQRIRQDPARRLEVLTEAGVRLGAALGVSMGLLDLPELLLHGPAEVVGAPLLEATERTINTHNRTSFRGEVSVRPTSLGEEIVLLGAFAFVRQRVLGVA